MPLVSLIIPAYNEENRLLATLDRIKKYIISKKLRCEVLVVDDGSTDSTLSIASRYRGMKIKVIQNRNNMGKGYSIWHGFQKASGDILVFSDADMSTPISYLSNFVSYHKVGWDVVIASRDLPDSKVKVPQNPFRELGGKFFNILVQTVAGLPIHDTQCGFKSFTRQAARIIFSRQTIFDFGFDAEILYIAKKHGLKIKETPVEWSNAPGTKVKFLRDSVKMFGELFKIRFNDLIGKYK
jgi:dolichyl-phosphate beta-glucosyltransferase